MNSLFLSYLCIEVAKNIPSKILSHKNCDINYPSKLSTKKVDEMWYHTFKVILCSLHGWQYLNAL